MTGADWVSDSVEEAFGFGLLVSISGTVGCNSLLEDDKVLSGLSGGDGGSDEEFELEISNLG